MSAILTVTGNARLNASFTQTILAGSSPNFPIGTLTPQALINQAPSYANAPSGSNNIDLISAQQVLVGTSASAFFLAGASNTMVDLEGVLVNSTTGFVRVREFIVQNLATVQGSYVLIYGPASNPWAPFAGAVLASPICIPPGGCFHLSDPFSTGSGTYPGFGLVGGGTASGFDLKAAVASTPVNIIVVGCSVI